MSTCRECHNDENQCGPLSASGECLECELSAADARDLAVLQELTENGYEGERRYTPSERIGCPECGCTDQMEEFGCRMCSNCGRMQ